MLNHDVTGVRPVDIHAHFFPQAYLDVLAEEGPRFNVEYRASDEGFYIKTDARFQAAGFWRRNIRASSRSQRQEPKRRFRALAKRPSKNR